MKKRISPYVANSGIGFNSNALAFKNHMSNARKQQEKKPKQNKK